MYLGYQHIYYALSYPYKIRKFSSDGKLLDTIERPGAEIEFPMEDETSPVIGMGCASKGLAVLPDGRIANIFTRLQNDEMEYYFDLFSPKGELLLTAPLSDCIENYTRSSHLYADKDGYVYLSQFDSYPSVVKYALNYYYREALLHENLVGRVGLYSL